MDLPTFAFGGHNAGTGSTGSMAEESQTGGAGMESQQLVPADDSHENMDKKRPSSTIACFCVRFLSSGRATPGSHTVGAQRRTRALEYIRNQMIRKLEQNKDSPEAVIWEKLQGKGSDKRLSRQEFLKQPAPYPHTSMCLACTTSAASARLLSSQSWGSGTGS